MSTGNQGLRLDPYDPAKHSRTHFNHNDRSEATVNVIARQQELDDLRRRQSRLTVLTGLLLLSLLALGVYGYFTLNRLEFPLNHFPALQQTVSAIDQRVVAAEDKLAAFTGNWDQLRGRVSAVEAKLRQNLKLAQDNAQQLTTQLHERMQAEMDERTRPLEARLANLESENAQERARLDQMEQTVAAVRTDTGRDLSVLNQATSRNEQGLNQLAQQLKRERVDFELAEDQTRELAPHVTLRVTSTNVAYQRINGWLWLPPERRTLWIRNLQANQSLVFRVEGSDVPHELVITQVGKDSVAGYLLLPAPTEGVQTSSTSSTGRTGSSN